jgi:hypothetical protein
MYGAITVGIRGCVPPRLPWAPDPNDDLHLVVCDSSRPKIPAPSGLPAER